MKIFHTYINVQRENPIRRISNTLSKLHGTIEKSQFTYFGILSGRNTFQPDSLDLTGRCQAGLVSMSIISLFLVLTVQY